MTFSEKIDLILRHNKLGINTVFGLEKYLGLSKGSIYKAYSGRTGFDGPGRKVTRAIQQGLKISDYWWDTGKGEIFVRQSTENPDINVLREALDVVMEQQKVQTRLIKQVVHENNKLWMLVKKQLQRK